MKLIVTALWLIALTGMGFLFYCGYVYLIPDAVKERIHGRKTYIFSTAIIVAPELLDFIASFDSLGLYDFVPSESQKRVTQFIGILTVVLRLLTMREQRIRREGEE